MTDGSFWEAIGEWITSLGPVHSGLGAIRTLDLTILPCNDIGAIRPFYTGIMGFVFHPHDATDQRIG